MSRNERAARHEKLIESYPVIKIHGAFVFAATSYYTHEAYSAVRRTKNRLLPGRDYLALKAEYDANARYFEDVQVMFTDEELDAWRAG